MAIKINPGIKKGGGDVLSKIGAGVGLLGGALLAPVTAGASLAAAIPAVAAGAATGAGIGKLAGSLGDAAAGTAGGDKPGVSVESAMTRRAQQLDYTEPGAQLQQAMEALKTQSQEVQSEYGPRLMKANELIRKRGF